MQVCAYLLRWGLIYLYISNLQESEKTDCEIYWDKILLTVVSCLSDKISQMLQHIYPRREIQIVCLCILAPGLYTDTPSLATYPQFVC